MWPSIHKFDFLCLEGDGNFDLRYIHDWTFNTKESEYGFCVSLF